MHSRQELIETAVLNHVVNITLGGGKTTRQNIHDDLVSMGLVKSSTFPSLNSIKVLCLNLQKRFNKLGIQLFETSAVIANNRYTVTLVALEYIKEFLHTPLYDEEGIEVSWIIQHPIVLNKEREMLI